MDFGEFLENGSAHFVPNLTIDLVVIGYEGDRLKCLLLQIGEKWLLPGGYIGRKESVETAAARILRERTGLEEPHLEFLSIFGNRDRQFRDEFKEFTTQSGLPWREDYWINERFISLAYYSLVNIRDIKPIPGALDQAAAWFAFEDLPEMWMDHKAIALAGQRRLKNDSRERIISHKLLPSPFTMPELHRLHQVILGEKIDRSRFQKKMLSSGAFNRLPKRQKDTPGRNPYQYVAKPGLNGAK